MSKPNQTADQTPKEARSAEIMGSEQDEYPYAKRLNRATYEAE